MTLYERRLCDLAGAAETSLGQTLQSRGGVRAAAADPEQLRYVVADQVPREVELTAKAFRCSCETCMETGACRHLVAAAVEARKTGLLHVLLQRHEGRLGALLLDAVDLMIQEAPVRTELVLSVEPAADASKPALQAGLRVGRDKLYVVRSMQAFFQAMREGGELSFGKGLTLNMTHFQAEEQMQPVIKLLADINETLCISGAMPAGPRAKWLPLTDGTAGTLLGLLKNIPFRLAADQQRMIPGIEECTLPLRFQVSEDSGGLSVNAYYPADILPLTQDCRYVLWKGNACATEAAQRRILPLLLHYGIDGSCTFSYDKATAERAAGELIPSLCLAGAVELSDALQRRMVREPLLSRVYLDRNGSEVAARVTFRYGEMEINPFAPAEQTRSWRMGDKLLLRDAQAEQQVLNCLDEAGFCVRNGYVSLSSQESILRFVTEGVRLLQPLCEVYLSRDFRRMAPRKPNLSGRLGMQGRQLVFTLEDDGEPSEEMLAILRAIADKKHYIRLRSGDFLDLSDLGQWTETARAVTEAAEQDRQGGAEEADGIRLQHYRVAYLAALIREAGLPIQRDEGVRTTVRALNGKAPCSPELPEGLSLRDYQQTGLEWLATLDRIGMGGILADDMGLGKTVEMIALLACNRAPREVSLIVAPTSLVYNWESELHRFAPSLSTAVLSGSAEQRKQLIEHVREHRDVDVLITSYPLIRRDSGELQEIPFRIAVLDEAQQIKNASSAGAAAVKQIQAQSRFALTGTPIENNTGELWSLFDFILPGYLGTYTAFMRTYQDGRNADALRQKIRPFLLRRLKRDVMAELPDKQERVLTARMSSEQEKVYQAAMLRLRGRVDRVLREKGLGRGRGEVLAAITELREICCHPALVMDGYHGTSGKIPLLLDLLPGALASGHRVLLFSQFTGMLKILHRQLDSEGIHCLYLDGETPAARRTALCERFNAGEGDVFLISLKAGGLGLNLPGADLVIHYDPWWNPAVEDQATDRAHRIGQTRKVEVIRLVMYGTIEEQVVSLGERKRALFDQLITPGELPLTALTEQDIRQLFS